MRRVAFSSDDDALLLKYIATYRPQPKGRLGIKLYERLVENAERKWSFSSRHSVQSWRERYKNNQPWFDAKILKYQEKHGISASEFDNSMAPVENGAKKRRRSVNAEDMNLYPGVVKKMRQETVSAQGGQPRDSTPPTRSPFAELRNMETVGADTSCHDDEEAVPVIGPDDYTGALPGSGESDQEVGGQSNDRGVSAPARVSRPPTPVNNAEVKPSPASRRSASPSLVRATETRGKPSFSDQQHDEDDIFSTPPPQAVQASPPPRTRRREAPHLVEGPFRSAYTISNEQFRSTLHVRSPSGTDEDAGTDGADEEWPPRRGKRKSPIPSEGPRLSTQGPIQAMGPAPVTSHNRLLFPAAPAHELPPPAPGSPSKSASLGQNPSLAVLDDPPVNDPFEVPLVNRETRRWTVAGDSEISWVDARPGDLVRRASVHHIDLRALHLGKSTRTSLTGRDISVGCSNVSGSSSATTKKWPRKPSRSSTPPNLSESNKKLVLSLGLDAVYSRMAENHKFHIDVVREVAAEQPSLEDTDRVLCNMRLAASREFARLLRQNEAPYSPVGSGTGESEEEDGDDDNSGDEEDDSLSVQPSHATLRSNHSPTSPIPQGRARRLALKIPTASPDPSPTRPSDYSPPTPTRARAYRRLERQGRIEEARLREARHVRRSLRSGSVEASPEADGQRITTYLLQRGEGRNGIPLENPRNTSGPGEDKTQEGGSVGRSISPALQEGHADADTRQFQGNRIAEGGRDPTHVVIDPVCDQEVPDDALPSPLGHDLENSRGFIDEGASNVTKAMADTHLSRRSELEDEDADTAEVEEQVDAEGDSQTLSDPQAMGPEAGSHIDSAGVDDGLISANARQSPPGNVSTEGIGHYSFPLDKKYAEKATSSLARSALATLSFLDAEWTNSDDERLLDGNLTEHEGLVRRKGLCSVKFRTAHLYSLLLDG